MYCPNCKKTFDGKFCPECGTKLIEEPQAGGFNINLGDSNAISGGINLYDSHNVQNVDNSVHNISNVLNITNVAAQKTKLELLREKESLFFNECKRAYEDNVLEQSEIVFLEEYRIKIGLDKATADKILDSARIMSEQAAKKTTLNPIARKKLQILIENIRKNDVNAITDQLVSFEALINKFDHEGLQRNYYLVLAALAPKKCIKQMENSRMDNYWKSFWSYLAYIKKKRISDAENILMSLDRFKDYPEDNMTLLAVAGALIQDNKREAKECLDAVTGEYTPDLQCFVDSLYLRIDPQMVIESSEDNCAFFLDNFFGKEDKDVVIESHPDDEVMAFREAKRQEKLDKLKDYIFGRTDKSDYKRLESEYYEMVQAIKGGAHTMPQLLQALADKGIYINRETAGADMSSGSSNGKWDEANVRRIMSNPNAKGKFGVFNAKGEQIVPFFGTLDDFFIIEDVTIINYNGDQHCFDYDGNKLFSSAKYEDFASFSEELFIVVYKGNYGLIDKTGNEVVPCKYGDIGHLSEGLASVMLNGNFGFIDEIGNEVIPCKYDEIESFSEGLSCVRVFDKWGFIDKTGNVVIPLKYDEVKSFSNGLALVKSGNSYAYIDKTGQIIIQGEHLTDNSYADGLALVLDKKSWNNKKYGYIDITGKVVIPCIYEEAEPFSEGLAMIRYKGKCGFINRAGKFVIPCIYDKANSFSNGLALVKSNREEIYIDKTGKTVITPSSYDIDLHFFDGVSFIGKYGRYGMIDNKGQEIIPCLYNEVGAINSKVFLIRL